MRIVYSMYVLNMLANVRRMVQRARPVLPVREIDCSTGVGWDQYVVRNIFYDFEEMNLALAGCVVGSIGVGRRKGDTCGEVSRKEIGGSVC